MNTTTISAPTTATSHLSHSLRLALVALAIVILLAVTFVAGQATGSTTKSTPAVVPTAGPSTDAPCHMGRPC